MAGSSAGAMTACAIACGYTPDETKDLILEVMKSLGKAPLSAAAMTRRSLLSSKKLRAVLTKAVNEKILPDQPDDVVRTFADLGDTPGSKTLYVVALDMATGQPVVFSPDITPHASVVDAVLASSAIPVAFPAQRLDVDGTVRRLADGGVWANYPAFVFRDPDFRAEHPEIDDGADARPTLGFLLDPHGGERVVKHPEAPIVSREGRPQPSDLGSAPREFGNFGALLTSPLAGVTAVVFPLLIMVLGVSWFHHELDDGLPLVENLPDGIEDFVLLVLILAFAFLVIASIGLSLLVLRLGRAPHRRGHGGRVDSDGRRTKRSLLGRQCGWRRVR